MMLMAIMITITLSEAWVRCVCYHFYQRYHYDLEKYDNSMITTMIKGSGDADGSQEEAVESSRGEKVDKFRISKSSFSSNLST